MAKPIIAALRTRRDLKESLQHTAQELAHLASIYGVAKVSYAYLADRCRCSRRTAMRHIQRLLDLRIIGRTRLRKLGEKFFDWNTYTFLISWDRSWSVGGSDKTARNLPLPEREKNSSVREDLEKQRRMLNWLYTPGSDQYVRTCEEIAYLEALLASATGEAVACRSR